MNSFTTHSVKPLFGAFLIPCPSVTLAFRLGDIRPVCEGMLWGGPTLLSSSPPEQRLPETTVQVRKTWAILGQTVVTTSKYIRPPELQGAETHLGQLRPLFVPPAIFPAPNQIPNRTVISGEREGFLLWIPYPSALVCLITFTADSWSQQLSLNIELLTTQTLLSVLYYK